MPPRLLQTFPNGFGQELAKVTKNYPQIHMAKGYDGRIGDTGTFISSVRSSSGYHGLIEIRSAAAATHFFRFFQILQIQKWKWKLKDPTCAIFLKSMGFKDIEYDIPVYQM